MNDDDAPADAHNPEQQSAPSRSAAKRDALARQELGTALTALSPEQWQSLELPDRLLGALTEYRRLKARGAKRRQLQFIGAIMRELDPAPIAELIDTLNGESAAARYQQHQAERWRERLLQAPAALTEFIDEYPQVDRQILRQLLDKARRALSPKASEGERKRSSRALFRMLAQTIGDAHASADGLSGQPAANYGEHQSSTTNSDQDA